MAFIVNRHSRNTQPQTDLVLVCDLDETLIHTLGMSKGTREVLKNESLIRIYNDPHMMDIRNRSMKMALDGVALRGNGIVHTCWCVKRPHLAEFLDFAFSYFKYVCVWSAGARSYVEEISRLISKDTPPFEVIYSRGDCHAESVILYDEKEEPYDGLMYTKPLQQMIDAYPELGDLSKMLIIDDNPDTLTYNTDNGILIPKYEPLPTIESLREGDDRLLQLKAWLQKLKPSDVSDVRTLDKTRIFS